MGSGGTTMLNNVPALNARNHLNNAQWGLNNTLGRLSSGMRINMASDDPAGLGISNSLRADVSALKQGVANAMNGISLVQYVDSALEQMSIILTRAVTLAEQAASDTSGADLSDNKMALDSEFLGLLSEIDRIASSTEFNGRNLLIPETGDTDIDDIVVEVSTSSNQADASNRITISTRTITVATLGMSASRLDTRLNAQSAMTAIKSAIDDISAQRVAFGVGSSRLTAAARVSGSGAENLQAAESRIRDADVAEEVINMTKYQILTNTSQTAVAQSNAAAQNLLRLLQG